MPITQLNNGASTATARAKINTIIDQLNGPSAPIQTPFIIHVSTSGNDTSGDGTMSNPFLTANAAFDYITNSISTNCIVDFGVGNFNYTSPDALNLDAWPVYLTTVRGQGILTELNVQIVCPSLQINADNLLLDVTASGVAGAAGADGTLSGSSGGTGGQGGDAPDVIILGSATIGSVSSSGGNGGTGGNGLHFDEEYGQGGYGGNGGSAYNKSITIRCPNIIGIISINGGVGGLPGINSYDGSTSPYSNGSNGESSGSTIITDGAYMVGSNLVSTYWKASRCSYSTGSPTTDYGGNAIIS